MAAADGQERDTGFAAFISYAHRDDRRARWLHRALEVYRLPGALAKERGRAKIGRVFLDRSELATSTSLSDRIEEALNGSANLLVVCSPAARASRWVNEEVRRFRALGRGGRIFCLIVDGDPAREDEGGCFPPALLETAPGEPPPEPLAADIRPGKDKPADARLKLVAGLLDLPFDALRRREAARRQRVLAIVAGVSLALLAVMAVLTTLALIARAEAERQRGRAVEQYQTAERTAGFLLGVLNQADPDKPGSGDKTLRQAVDETAGRLLAVPALSRDPDMKASLLAMMTDVYGNMGQVRDARRLIDVALKEPARDPQIRIRVLVADAKLRLSESDFAGMRQSLREAFGLLSRHAELRTYRPVLLTCRAQLAAAEGDHAAARRDWAEVRRLSLAATPPDRDNALFALLGEGIAAVDADDPARGAPLLRQVIAEREAMGQPLHPQVLSAINTLGAVAVKQGQPIEAERAFRKAERLRVRLFGDASLIVAQTRSNLGRALVEQGRFAEAAGVLRRARAGAVAQAGNRVDTMAFLEDSLGLALGGLGDAAGARAAFAHGLSVAHELDMPKEVELLADRAELECRAGATAVGTKLAAEARTALARFALPEPWRRARLDAVEGGCLLAAGRPQAARPLLARAAAPVAARWGAASLFGRQVRDDARRAGLRP